MIDGKVKYGYGHDETNELPWYVNKNDGTGIVAKFMERDQAVTFTEGHNRNVEINCCERSLHSGGWHHNDSCGSAGMVD